MAEKAQNPYAGYSLAEIKEAQARAKADWEKTKKQVNEQARLAAKAAKARSVSINAALKDCGPILVKHIDLLGDLEFRAVQKAIHDGLLRGVKKPELRVKVEDKAKKLTEGLKEYRDSLLMAKKVAGEKEAAREAPKPQEAAKPTQPVAAPAQPRPVPGVGQVGQGGQSSPAGRSYVNPNTRA